MLEIGTGVGFLPIRVVQVSQGVTIMAQDLRPGTGGTRPEIERAARAWENSARLKWTDGPLRFATDEGAQASGLAAYLRDFRPIALRLNRPADVAPETLAAQDLGTITRVLVPFVSEEEAAKLRAGYGPVLEAMGFIENVERAGGGSLQFDGNRA